MNLEKAIQILTVMSKEKVYLLAPDGGDAVLLLIEAGKRVQLTRKIKDFVDVALLPGETED